MVGVGQRGLMSKLIDLNKLSSALKSKILKGHSIKPKRAKNEEKNPIRIIFDGDSENDNDFS